MAASAMRSTEPPHTSTTGGPWPSRSNPIVVPSFEVTWSMTPPSALPQLVRPRSADNSIGPARTRSFQLRSEAERSEGLDAEGGDPAHQPIETSVIDDSTSRASCRDRSVLRLPGGPVDLDRHPTGGDRLRSDQLERYVGAGVGEQPRALADDQREGEQVDLVVEVGVAHAHEQT